MISISNSIFDVKGSSIKDKTYGITLNGSEDVVISNCKFENVGYSAIYNNCKGSVSVENCEFNCVGIYNPIEGSQSVDNGSVIVKNCSFKGNPGNNYINFYQVADGSKHEISNCSFEPSVDNNIIRISNRESAAMDVIVKDCEYTFAEGEAHDYTGFLLCQDYTNKSGKKQSFTNVKVEIDNVLCDDVKIDAENGASKGSVYYVYEDGKGIITGENDPIIVIR